MADFVLDEIDETEQDSSLPVPTDEEPDERLLAPYFVVNVMGDNAYGHPVHLKAVVGSYDEALLLLARIGEDFQERGISGRASGRYHESPASRQAPKQSAAEREAWSPGRSQGVPCGIPGCSNVVKDWYDKATGELRMTAQQLAEVHTRKYGGPRCFIHQPRGGR